MSRYNDYDLIRNKDIVIPFLDNSTIIIVDTEYGNSLNMFSDNKDVNDKVVIFVDWGDGSDEIFNIRSGSISHKYSVSGKFKVIIKHNRDVNLKFFDQPIITELIKLGTMPNYNGTFMQCENLNKLHNDCLDLNPYTKELINTFQNCYSLKTIPYNLLHKFYELENIDGLFNGCGLIEIPYNFLNNNFKLQSLNSTFKNTQITNLKSELFKMNKEIINLKSCFAGSGVKNVEANIFDTLTKLKDASYLFCDCYSLETIPEDLFKYCTNLNYVTRMFYNAKSLKHFPLSTFKYNKRIFNDRYVLVGSGVNASQQIIW